jgi:hypothetical protein
LELDVISAPKVKVKTSKLLNLSFYVNKPSIKGKGKLKNV